MSQFNSVEEAIGKIVNNTDEVQCISGKDSTGRTMVKVRCTLCNSTRDLRWDKVNWGSARKCDCQKSKGQKIQIGDIIDNDKVIGESRKSNRPSVILQCQLCGRTRNVERFKFGSNRVDKCECHVKQYKDYTQAYKHLIGTVCERLETKVLDVLKAQEVSNNGGYLGIMLKVQCTNCGSIRYVKAAPYLRGDDWLVDRCICDNLSKPNNKLHGEDLDKALNIKYKDLLHKQIGKLTVNRIFSKGEVAYCECTCQCSRDKTNIVEYTVSELKTGRVKSCGCLSTSAGESIVEDILISLNVQYVREYTYEDLKSPRNYKLRYDFAVVTKENKEILIEYNGRQHYNYETSKEFFRDKSDFEYLVMCDKIKMKYANDNNIPILVLKHTLDNKEIREEILKFLLGNNVLQTQ